MSIDAWADEIRRSQYSYPEDADQAKRLIDTLTTIFEGKEDPDRAASTIASIFDPLLKRGFRIPPVAGLWAIICRAVKILGGDREIDQRLIALLNSISKLPDVTDKYGNPVGTGPFKVHGVYWRHLPCLADMFRDDAIYIYDEDVGEIPGMADEGDWPDALRSELLNVITFSALCLAHGPQNIGMSFHVEVSLIHGIEGPYQTPEQQRCAATNVPPAATCILLAGPKIHELCKNGKLDKHGRGYSPGRWALWKTKFGEVATNPGLGDEVKDMALKAASEMGRIELLTQEE